MIRSLIFILFLVLGHQVAYALEGATVGCRGDKAHIKRVRIGGQVLLNTNLLPKGTSQLQEALKAAVEMQVRHFIGYFRTTKAEGLNANIASYRHLVSIGEPEKTTYGSDLEITNYALPQRNLVGGRAPEYVKLAIEKGSLKKEDDALRVPYEMEVLLADCSEGDALTTHPLYMPLDPYMTFWLENQKDHHKRRFAGTELESTSDCLASEIVDFGAADRSWFFWSPVEKKLSPGGKSHLCKSTQDKAKVYTPKVEVTELVVEPKNIKSSFFAQRAKNKPYKFYSVFGVISNNPEFKAIDFEDYRKLIHEKESLCSKAKTVPECIEGWNTALKLKEGEKIYEPGASNVFLFLRDMRSVISVKSFKELPTASPKSEIKIQISGAFLNSKIPLELNIYFGTTTLDYGENDKTKAYGEFLSQALSEADAISYLGHSGIGYNVSLEHYEDLWKNFKIRFPKRQNPLWFGIYNCEGFSYFGFDQKRLFTSKKVDLMLTSSTGVEADSRLPMAQLMIFGQAIQNSETGVDIKNVFGKYIQSKDFYVLLKLTENDF